MSSVLRSNVKLCRLYRKGFHIRAQSQSYFLGQRRIVHIRTQHACLATAAHKYELNDGAAASSIKSSFVASKSDGEVLKSIDDAFLDIDNNVRRTGRAFGKRVVVLFSKIKEIGIPSSKHCLYLVRSCEKIFDKLPSERIELATEIWNKYKELGCQFDISHFNSLLKVYVENSHQFSPPEFLSNMERQGVEPNKLTYLYLIEKYCKDGNLNGTSEVLEFMKEKNIPLNENAFNSLIKGHVKLNDFDGAKKMLDVMRTSNLSPTADSYIALACGYAEKGNTDGIKSCLKLGESYNMTFETPHYLQIIFAAASMGHQECVEEILKNVQNAYEHVQDFINIALELIHRDAVAVAYKLITVSSTQHYFQGYNVFIKVLIEAGKPIEEIIQYCQDIHTRGSDKFVFVNAVKAAIESHMFDHALSLLEQAQTKGVPPRRHFFSSILSYYKDRNMSEGVLSTLKSMFKLGVVIDFISYVDYIFPAFGILNPEELLSKIQETGHSVDTAIDPLFHYYCMNREIDKALFLCENYEVCVSNNFPLEEFLSMPNQQNSVTYLKVLKSLFDNAGLHREDQEAVRGKFLAELICVNSSILNGLLNQQGLTVSKQCLDVCRSLLRQKNPTLLVKLRKLEDPRHWMEHKLTVEEEDAHLKNLTKQGISPKPFLMGQLLHHIDNKNVDRACRIQTCLKDYGFPLTPFSHMKLIRLLCASNDLEKTVLQKKQLKEDYPAFNHGTLLNLEYAGLLIKFAKFEEALEILKNECQEPAYVTNQEILSRCLKHLINIVVETGDVELVRNVQSALLPLVGHNSRLKNLLLEPLILVHLHRNDLEAAVEEYRNCIKNNHVSVCLTLLLKKCIYSEEQRKLQKVIDLAADCIGKNIALHELALAFVEIGYINQALRVMQDLGNKADGAYVIEICKKLCEAKKGPELEQFVSITRDLNHIDKGSLYHYLLQHYVDQKDYKNCLFIWNHLKSQNIKLSEAMLKMLHLVIPENQLSDRSVLGEGSFPGEKKSGTAISSNRETEIFLKYLNDREITSALKELQRIKKGYIRSLTFNDMTLLLDLLLKEKRVMELSPNVQAMSYIIENSNEIMKPLLEKYSKAGDVNTIIAVGDFLPDFSKKSISYNSYLGKAYITSGKERDLMCELEKLYDAKNKLFSNVAFEELLKIPELEERVHRLALKYLEVKYDTPISVVWAHYFVKENYDKANEISKLHPIRVEKIDSKVIRTIQQQENIVMGRKFLDLMHDLNVKTRLKERAYKALLDILVHKEMLDEAVALVADSESYKISLRDSCPSTLIALKDALKREGKPVPFRISSEDADFGLTLESGGS